MDGGSEWAFWWGAQSGKYTRRGSVAKLIEAYMKKVILALSLVSLVACMPYQSVTSTDPNWMRMGGDAPEGYPRTFVENLSGNCSLVTESWSESRINGRLLWTKKQSRKAATCPKASPL